MADIIVRQANTTSLTVQTSSNQVIVRQQPSNTVVVQTTGNSYVLPVATANTLGGIIVGDNLTINANGLLSAQAGGVSTFNNRTGNVTLTANDVTSVANGVYLADTLSNISMSYGTDAVQGMNKTTASVSFLSGLTGLNRGVTAARSGNLIASIELNSDDLFGGVLIRHNNDSIFFNYDGLQALTSTANYSWSASSFITQGRADSRYATPANLTAYLPTANFTYANLTGKPTFANVATSGSYADLSGTPDLSIYLPSANFTYANIGGTIPTATNTTLGAIKVGSNLTISNGTLSANIPTAGFTNGDTLNGGSY